eukprot:3935451-Rhodomonas_salina.2
MFGTIRALTIPIAPRRILRVKLILFRTGVILFQTFREELGSDPFPDKEARSDPFLGFSRHIRLFSPSRTQPGEQGEQASRVEGKGIVRGNSSSRSPCA